MTEEGAQRRETVDERIEAFGRMFEQPFIQAIKHHAWDLFPTEWPIGVLIVRFTVGPDGVPSGPMTLTAMQDGGEERSATPSREFLQLFDSIVAFNQAYSKTPVIAFRMERMGDAFSWMYADGPTGTPWWPL